MTTTDVLTLTPAGLYCAAGDFHIDPTRAVSHALITHGHSDHARAGHDAVMATAETLAIMQLRYGADFTTRRQTANYGERQRIGDVEVGFYPAGHVLGSAQIAIVRNGVTVVVSGDYKRAADPTCASFEVVPCDVFVTEATFGLPVFRHPDADGEIRKLLHSRAIFPHRAHLVGAYSLGKAQRVMALLRRQGYDRPIYIHGAMQKITEFYASRGINVGDIRLVAGLDRGKLGGEIVIGPPAAMNDLWARKFPDPLTSFASGWMRVRARARQSGVELPLVVSDHADWGELTATIADTGCREVWVTHGEEDALVYWARGIGLEAQPLHMLGYGDEEALEIVSAEGEA